MRLVGDLPVDLGRPEEEVGADYGPPHGLHARIHRVDRLQERGTAFP